MNRDMVKGISLTLLVATLAFPAHAAGSGMPWEAPLQSILESIEGPVAKIIAVMIIIIITVSLLDILSQRLRRLFV